MAITPPRDAQELVLVPNALNGSVALVRATAAHPSQRSLDLAGALGALATYDGAGLWDPTPDAAGAKWLGDLDDALELRSITRAEWARLLTAFGRVWETRGLLTKAGGQELESLARLRLGPGGRG